MSALTRTQDSDDEGQFDDAAEDISTSLTAFTVDQPQRGGANYIDDDMPESDEDVDEISPWDASDEEVHDEVFEELRAEDEDWEMAERGESSVMFLFVVSVYDMVTI